MMGKIYIGQKNTRGVKGQKTVCAEGFKNIDVTSASRNLLGSARIPATTLSPMKLGPVVDENGLRSLLFENYWQFSKYWKSADHIYLSGSNAGQPTPKWFAFRGKGFALTKGKRRPLPLREYGRPDGAIYNDRVYGYLESRKEIYVPFYAQLIRDLPAIAALKEMIRNGENLMIVDNDGPPRSLYPNGMEMTEENWRKMIDDALFPFGHGYIVAALVANLASLSFSFSPASSSSSAFPVASSSARNAGEKGKKRKRNDTDDDDADE